MERFNALGRGAQLMLIGAVLLFIDLFLPWQDFGNEFSDAVGVDASFSGWRGIAGFILGLLTIILLAWLVVRIASVNIPLPVSTAMTAALIGTLILIFAIIKLLSILGDEATFWAWIGLALAIVIAVGAFQTVQEAGGVANLQSEASSLTGSMGGGAAAEAPVEAAPQEAPVPPTAPEPMTPAEPEPAAEAAPAPTDTSSYAAGEPMDDAADAASEAADDLTDGPSTGTGA